ncbi:MAG: WG repeat-containing protein [Flavobacteriales bacterium]|nr:WG repeat-containing protein [Flavobacteriales bacterium]
MKKIVLYLTFLIPLHIVFAYAVAQTNNIYIPYRVGDKWGVSDTNGVLIVEPQYDEVSMNPSNRATDFDLMDFNRFNDRLSNRQDLYFMNDLVYCRVGKMWGALYQNMEIIAPTFKSITLIKPFFFCATDTNGFELFNLNGKKVFDEKINWYYFPELVQGYSISKKVYVMRTLTGNYHVFQYDASEGRIVTMIGVWNENPTFEQVNINSWYVSNRKNEKGVLLTWSANSFEAKDTVFNPIKYSISKGDIHSAKSALEAWRKQKQNHRIVHHYSVMKSEKDVHGRIEKWNEMLDAYDTVRLENYVEIGFQNTGNDLDTVDSYSDYFLTFDKKGRCGIETHHSVIPPQFSTIKGYRFQNNYLFLVSKKTNSEQLKYGILDEFGKIIVPFKYYEILELEGYSGNFFWFKNEKKGTIRIFKPAPKPTFEIYFDEQYDSIDSTFWGHYLYIGNQKRLFLSYGHDLSPLFPSKYEIEPAHYQNFPLWFLTDENFNPIGYANSRGILYFKD